MEEKIYLLDLDYIEEETERGMEATVRLWGKNGEGKSVVAWDRAFDPYFYYVPGDFPLAKERLEGVDEPRIKGVEEAEKILGKEEVKALRVYGSRPSDLPKLRDKLKGEGFDGERFYEYGMSFYRQYVVSKGLLPASWVLVKGKEVEKEGFDLAFEAGEVQALEGEEEAPLKTLAFDLETYESQEGRGIIMLSLAGDKKGYRKVLTYKGEGYGDEVEVVGGEKELLQRFLEIVEEEDPDILLTYNGDGYDFRVLRERAEELGVELTMGRGGSRLEFARRGRVSSARLGGRVHIDLFSFVNLALAGHLETEVLTLDAVAAELLGERKIEMEMEEMLEKWRREEDLGKLARYSLKDSGITCRLGEQLLPQIYALCNLTAQTPYDCSRMSYGQLVEWFLIKEAHGERIVPNRPKWKELQKRRELEPYKGGFVREPVVGMHENLAVLDFQSLYPSIIASYNIAPETVNCDCCKGGEVEGVRLCREKRGFIPSLLRGLIEERSRIKEKLEGVEEPLEHRTLDNRQYALKILANSTYGYFGYVGARWYCRDCARVTSALGREWIKKVMGMAEEEGFRVIYGDTDSLIIKDGEPRSFLEKVNSQLPGIMNLEMEGRFARGLFVREKKGRGAKKRYALLDGKGGMKVRGFETVRRDWCSLAKRAQREILYILLSENSVPRATRHARRVIERLESKDVSLRDLIIYTSLTKAPGDYETTSPHVSAARKLEEKGRVVKPGSVIMYVVVEGKGSISERALPVEFATIEEVDSEYYIENQIVPAALRVLGVMGVDERELRGGGTQETIEEFF